MLMFLALAHCCGEGLPKQTRQQSLRLSSRQPIYERPGQGIWEGKRLPRQLNMRYARQVVSSVVSLALPMADVTAAALVEVLHRLIQVVAVLWDHMAGTVVDTHVAVPLVGWVVVLRRKQRMSRS